MSVVLDLTQKAIRWPVSKADKGGRSTHTSPVQVNSRWEEHVELVTDPNGEQAVTVVRAFVDVDLNKGDFLKLGTLASGTSSDPRTVAGALRVLLFKKTPDLTGEEFLRVALLGRA